MNMEGNKQANHSVMETPKEASVAEERKSIAGELGELVSELEVKTLIHNVVTYVESRSKEDMYTDSYRVAKRVEKTVSRQGAKGMIGDMIVAGALLAPSFKFMEAHKNYHPIEFGAIVRENELNEGVSDQVFEAVERIVRGYLGADSAIKEFIPKPGSPEYLVATAYELLVD